MQTLLNFLGKLEIDVMFVDNEMVVRFVNRTLARRLGLEEGAWEGRVLGKISGLWALESDLKAGITSGSVLIGSKQFWIQCIAIDCFDDIAQGTVIICFDFDVKGVKEEIKRLRLLEREFEAVLNHLNEGILISDKHGRILRANQAMEGLTGLKKSDYLGKSFQELFSSNVFLEELVTLRAMRQQKSLTALQRIKTGKETVVRACQVFDENGELFRFISNFHDVTELNFLKVQLDKALRKTNKFSSELSEQRLEKIKENLVITKNKSMSVLLETAMRIARTDATVLLSGESGVGKGLLAQLIHDFSERNEEPFIKVNCGAIPAALMESEMFGYESGAFTGARKEGKPGLFELAHKGTLFLDEIGELSVDLQVKLLKAVQEQMILRVGGTQERQVDLRIIAATNRDLEKEVASGRFREDLFYRLNVVPFRIPPIRERKDDIPLLMNHFLSIHNHKYRQDKKFSPAALDVLINYEWPGNVRELNNLVERLVITLKQDLIDVNDLPNKILQSESFAYNAEAQSRTSKLPVDLQEAMRVRIGSQGALRDIMDDVEKVIVQRVCQEFRSVRQAAKVLGLSHTALQHKLQKHGITLNSSRIKSNGVS